LFDREAISEKRARDSGGTPVMEQQLIFTIGIMSPQSIQTYGVLMQVSKSINEAASQWDTSLFENNRVAKLLSMARTTKRNGMSYYICTRTWKYWHVKFGAKFYIPMSENKRKRKPKNILRDYVMHMRSAENNKGIIHAELRKSFKNQLLDDVLNHRI
jgi:hypothetical protein